MVIERYERALRSIANSSCCGTCQEAAMVARKALTGDGARPDAGSAWVQSADAPRADTNATDSSLSSALPVRQERARLQALIVKWRTWNAYPSDTPEHRGWRNASNSCANNLEAALGAGEPPQAGLFLTNEQVEQVMNALEGWDGKDAALDEQHRRAAFEMIQGAGEPRSTPPIDEWSTVDDVINNGVNLRVIRQAYGWVVDQEGNVEGLTAGDHGFEPTGIKLQDFAKYYVERAPVGAGEPPARPRLEEKETKNAVSRGDGSCLPEGSGLPQRPSEPTSTSVENEVPWREGPPICTNCGESAKPHPAYADFVGPFCEGCWDKLREYFTSDVICPVCKHEHDREPSDCMVRS